MKTACIRYNGKPPNDKHWYPWNAAFSFGWGAAHPSKPHHAYYNLLHASADAEWQTVGWYFDGIEPVAGKSLGAVQSRELSQYCVARGTRVLGCDVTDDNTVIPRRGVDYAAGESVFLPMTFPFGSAPLAGLYYNHANPHVRAWLAQRIAYCASQNEGRVFLDCAGVPVRLFGKGWLAGDSCLDQTTSLMDQWEDILNRVATAITPLSLQAIVNANYCWPGWPREGDALFFRWVRNPHVVGVMFERHWTRYCEGAHAEAHRRLVGHLAVEGKFAHFHTSIPPERRQEFGDDKASLFAYCEAEYVRHYMLLRALDCSEHIVLSVHHPTGLSYAWQEDA